MFESWLTRHRRSVVVIFLLLAAGGVASAFRLPVLLLPRVSFPRIVVTMDAGDRPAGRMAIQVTRPVEEALRGIPGVRRVRSTTSRGSAEISLSFDWAQDMVGAMLMTESAVNQQTASLPTGTQFAVRRMDPTVFPVLAYSLTSDTLSLTQLHDIAQYRLRPAVATVDGVGHASVLGGREEEYRITVDLAKLRSFGLGVSDVVDAVAASNVLSAVGRVQDLHKLYLVVSRSSAADLEALGSIVVTNGPDGAVQVEDVAILSDEVVPTWTRVTADGRDAVLLQVYQQPAGSTVAVAQKVRALIDRERRNLPGGLQIRPWYGQSDLILASAGSVRDAILVGVGLACLVLLGFLRNLRVTLIATIVVPGVLASVVLLLDVFGMSFNMMTLGGMAAAVGLVIDDAIVMVEHIEARRKIAGGTLRAAAELTPPLVASSSVTVIVFLPLAFLSGVTGAFFKALSLTMASSLVVSFFVAYLLVPVLAERLLPIGDDGVDEQGRVLVLTQRAYRSLVERGLRRPWLAGLLVLPLIAGGYTSYRALGSGFMPAMDEGGFILDYHAPPGTSLDETDRLVRQVEAILRGTPEVHSYSRRTGVQLGGGLTEANEGDFFVQLHDQRTRGVDAVMSDVRARVLGHVPGLEIEMAQLMEDLIGDLTAVPQPIEVEVFSNDEAVLNQAAYNVKRAIGGVAGVVDVSPGIVLAGDALDIEVDPMRAAIEGMTPQSVTTALKRQLEGTVATKVQHDPKMVGVRVWVPRGARRTVYDVERLRIRAPDGHAFTLRRVARVRRISGQPQITRDDLRRMVAVTGRIVARDMGSTIADVRAALDKAGIIPKGASYRLGGLYAEQQKAFGGLIAVFSAAVALVFMILLFVYESFRIVLAMMTTTLLSMCAVLLGLWLTGSELDISSMMGMTMVVGIVTEVAVFYVSQVESIRDSGDPGEPLLRAGLDRLRPIAMTTLAATLALLPLAIPGATGASMQQPLAIAIISGLSVQMPLVLVVLPILLRLFRVR